MKQCSFPFSLCATWRHWSRFFSAIPQHMGRRIKLSFNSSTSALAWVAPLALSRSSRNQRAISARTVTWVVNALVDATAFSRPALQYTPSLVVRAMRLPTAFTTLITVRSFSFAALTTLATSLVSPLCDTTRKALSFVLFASRGKSFESVSAASKLCTVSKEPRCFMSFSAYLAAFKEVPHADRVRYLILAKLSLIFSSPPS
mmetsp:Transcript_11493/g.17442  ORF Transcript_11493/g.17442 Transcript_11493/m.17442 type:complete len:202 (-) Transcript_11493:399-1004(-)